MTAKLWIQFDEDGGCKIGDAQTDKRLHVWSVDQVSQTIQVARVCMESRRDGPCDCTACQVYVAHKMWKLVVPQFILHSPERHGLRPMEDDDGNITSDGALGRVTADNVTLKAYADYPTDVRPKDLEVGGRIEDVEIAISGECDTYDIYRVR